MSKEKVQENRPANALKEKKKLSAFDIVSKVFSCAAAAVIPFVAYYLNLIYIEFQSTALGWINSYIGREDDTQGITYEYLSIRRVVKEFLPMLDGGETKTDFASQLWNLFAPFHKWIYATVILFAVALAVAVAVIIVSIFSRNNKLPLILSAVGLVSLIAMAVTFRQITAPIVSGEFELIGKLAELLSANSGDGLFSLVTGAISMLLGSGTASDLIVKFRVINFSTAWVVMIICYVTLIVWHGALLVVNLGEKEKEPAKKIKSK